jgi:prolyl-tRNA synthetase
VKRRSATKEAMGAKTLCLPLEQPELPEGTPCFITGKPAKNWCACAAEDECVWGGAGG